MANIANQPSPSQVSGRLATWHRVMEQAGLTYEALQMPIDDPKMRKRLVLFWLSGGYSPTISQKDARKIMGENFFGVEEAIRHFGVEPTEAQVAQIRAFAKVPFPEEVLRQVKDTHILVAVFPLSILDIRAKTEDLFHDRTRYNSEKFAQDKGKFGWYLVRKHILPDSTGKTWQAQQELLKNNEEVSTAKVMIYTIIGHYLATSERLFEKVYNRCSDVFSGGSRICVGGFDSWGLQVGDWNDDFPYDYIGLTPSRSSKLRVES